MKEKERETHLRYLVDLSKKGGPSVFEYQELTEWYRMTMRMLSEGQISKQHIRDLWDQCGDAFSLNTIQGILVRKPYGYAGDYEIIDKIHTEWTSPLPHLKQWDLYLHSTAAPQAVRNRKKYFQTILREVEVSSSLAPKVLNIGSGPARDLQQWFLNNPTTKLSFDCIDMEPKAIQYASNVIEVFNHLVNWHCMNVFRYTTNERYDLIWSAGLFDYLDDKQFVFLLKRLHKMMNNGGSIVVGNFSQNNPTRANMEFGEWFVNHRTEEDLVRLACDSGIPLGAVSVTKEPLGVNLFLCVNNRNAIT